MKKNKSIIALAVLFLMTLLTQPVFAGAAKASGAIAKQNAIPVGIIALIIVGAILFIGAIVALTLVARRRRRVRRNNTPPPPPRRRRRGAKVIIVR
ncbi:MAG: hypothetical protein GY810_08490 [Aureispira sp.]|nr:hypothetical protein [Aureispira sp.]